jgi:hypothetical protein
MLVGDFARTAYYLEALHNVFGGLIENIFVYKNQAFPNLTL